MKLVFVADFLGDVGGTAWGSDGRSTLENFGDIFGSSGKLYIHTYISFGYLSVGNDKLFCFVLMKRKTPRDSLWKTTEKHKSFYTSVTGRRTKTQAYDFVFQSNFE
jgi:hypothetical protein